MGGTRNVCLLGGWRVDKHMERGESSWMKQEEKHDDDDDDEERGKEERKEDESDVDIRCFHKRLTRTHMYTYLGKG